MIPGCGNVLILQLLHCGRGSQRHWDDNVVYVVDTFTVSPVHWKLARTNHTTFISTCSPESLHTSKSPGYNLTSDSVLIITTECSLAVVNINQLCTCDFFRCRFVRLGVSTSSVLSSVLGENMPDWDAHMAAKQQ